MVKLNLINVGTAREQTAKLDYPVEPGNDKEAARLGNNLKGTRRALHHNVGTAPPNSPNTRPVFTE